MKHPRFRIIVPICIVILLVAIMPAPAGAFPQSTRSNRGDIDYSADRFVNHPASIATPSATVVPGEDSTDPPIEAQAGGANGETIRKRVLGMTIAGAVIASLSLLLLWIYSLLRDPVRRHRASTRIRQLRREERRERARRRRIE